MRLSCAHANLGLSNPPEKPVARNKQKRIETSRTHASFCFCKHTLPHTFQNLAADAFWSRSPDRTVNDSCVVCQENAAAERELTAVLWLQNMWILLLQGSDGGISRARVIGYGRSDHTTTVNCNWLQSAGATSLRNVCASSVAAMAAAPRAQRQPPAAA